MKKQDIEKNCKAILVVEDDDDLRELVVETLKSEGFLVEAASNGAEGLHKLKKMPVPTLVFLDLMMPSMNGWEFLDARDKSELLANHKVVTISALTASESLEDSTPLKVDGAITKPLSLDRIWQSAIKYCQPVAVLAS